LRVQDLAAEDEDTGGDDRSDGRNAEFATSDFAFLFAPGK
jgi:hypothetical protein